MGTKTVFALIVIIGCCGAAALKAFGPTGFAGRSGAALAATPGWSEIPWPFLMDQWGKGKAFRCKAADCGTDVDLYVRPKIGFCNCATGVADDDELERVADVSMLDDHYAPLAPGRPIHVGHMAGRSRPYAVESGAHERTLALAFNDHCDVIVATAVVARGEPTIAEPAVLAFLNGDAMMRWAEAALGL